MRIVFYCGHKYWGGLSNNGGSRTILLSAKTLSELGHEVDVVACSDKFTWFEHKNTLKKIPKKVDAIIACSVSDIDGMYRYAPKTAKKFYWMRGLEVWQVSEHIIKEQLQRGHRNIVNSSWLKRTLDKWNVSSDLVWQGVDINFWYQKSQLNKDGIPKIGCLYNTHHHTKRWDMFVDIMNRLKDEYKYWGLGTENPKEHLDCFLKNPKPYSLRSFYEQINIWFAPTELDSFHNCPLEAALCGALILCRKIKSNGMEDYATDETAMRFNTIDEAIEMIKNPDYSKVKKMQELIINKIGDRKTNMIKFLEVLNG